MRAPLLVTVVVAVLGCGDGEQRPTTPRAPAEAPVTPPDARLILISDLNGYLEPCGCQSRPLGGIDKAATRIGELRRERVPTFFLHAGDLFFDTLHAHGPGAGGGADPERATQDLWQAQTLARILGRLGLDASTFGPGDREWEALSTEAAFALLGRTPGEPQRLLLERGGMKLGVLALTVGDAQVGASAQAAADGLRAQGARVVIALAVGEARPVRRLAGVLKNVDFVLHGGADTPERVPPERIGDSTLLRPPHHGQALLALDIAAPRPGPLSDHSPWTRQATQAALDRRIAGLERRITQWEREGRGDSPDVATQRARLAQMRQERQALQAPPAARGNHFVARLIELSPGVPDDPAIGELLAAHDKRVNQHNRKALAEREPLPVAPGAPAYLGVEACEPCHAPAVQWWRGHAHGRAYATLVKRDKQFNLSCVGCHVTGYGQPGGAAVVQNEGLTDVGCESCHGPGSLHAQDPTVAADKNVRREVAERVCVACHNEEHSDRFVYEAYKAMLIARGHGLPPAAAEAK